jgi:hypothetical protein
MVGAAVVCLCRRAHDWHRMRAPFEVVVCQPALPWLPVSFSGSSHCYMPSAAANAQWWRQALPAPCCCYTALHADQTAFATHANGSYVWYLSSAAHWRFWLSQVASGMTTSRQATAGGRCPSSGERSQGSRIMHRALASGSQQIYLMDRRPFTAAGGQDSTGRVAENSVSLSGGPEPTCRASDRTIQCWEQLAGPGNVCLTDA